VCAQVVIPRPRYFPWEEILAARRVRACGKLGAFCALFARSGPRATTGHHRLPGPPQVTTGSQGHHRSPQAPRDTTGSQGHHRLPGPPQATTGSQGHHMGRSLGQLGTPRAARGSLGQLEDPSGSSRIPRAARDPSGSSGSPSREKWGAANFLKPLCCGRLMVVGGSFSRILAGFSAASGRYLGSASWRGTH